MRNPSEVFNALPFEIREQTIGTSLEQSIRELQREKQRICKYHRQCLSDIREREKYMGKELEKWKSQ